MEELSALQQRLRQQRTGYCDPEPVPGAVPQCRRSKKQHQREKRQQKTGLLCRKTPETIRDVV